MIRLKKTSQAVAAPQKPGRRQLPLEETRTANLRNGALRSNGDGKPALVVAYGPKKEKLGTISAEACETAITKVRKNLATCHASDSKSMELLDRLDEGVFELNLDEGESKLKMKSLDKINESDRILVANLIVEQIGDQLEELPVENKDAKLIPAATVKQPRKKASVEEMTRTVYRILKTQHVESKEELLGLVQEAHPKNKIAMGYLNLLLTNVYSNHPKMKGLISKEEKKVQELDTMLHTGSVKELADEILKRIAERKEGHYNHRELGTAIDDLNTLLIALQRKTQ